MDVLSDKTSNATELSVNVRADGIPSIVEIAVSVGVGECHEGAYSALR